MGDSYRDILSSVYSNALAKAWCKLLEDKGYHCEAHLLLNAISASRLFASWRD